MIALVGWVVPSMALPKAAGSSTWASTATTASLDAAYRFGCGGRLRGGHHGAGRVDHNRIGVGAPDIDTEPQRLHRLFSRKST